MAFMNLSSVFRYADVALSRINIRKQSEETLHGRTFFKVLVNICRLNWSVFGFLEISAAELLRNGRIPSLEVTELLKKEKAGNCTFLQKIFCLV